MQVELNFIQKNLYKLVYDRAFIYLKDFYGQDKINDFMNIINNNQSIDDKYINLNINELWENNFNLAILRRSVSFIDVYGRISDMTKPHEQRVPDNYGNIPIQELFYIIIFLSNYINGDEQFVFPNREIDIINEFHQALGYFNQSNEPVLNNNRCFDILTPGSDTIKFIIYFKKLYKQMNTNNFTERQVYIGSLLAFIGTWAQFKRWETRDELHNNQASLAKLCNCFFRIYKYYFNSFNQNNSNQIEFTTTIICKNNFNDRKRIIQSPVNNSNLKKRHELFNE